MDDRAQVQWTPELSVVEFPPDPGVGGQDEEAAARAWIQGPSSAAIRLRDQAAELASTGFSAALVVGEPGTGKHRVAQWIHGHCSRADRTLAMVDAGSPSVDIQLRHVNQLMRDGQPALHPGNIVVRDLQRAEPHIAAELEAMLSRQTRPIRCGLLLLSTQPIAKLRTRSLEHGRLLHQASRMIEVPSLRERRADIGILAKGFLDEASERYGRPVRGISPQAMASLESHPFGGNLRELACIIEQAILRCHGDWVTSECLRGLLAAEEPPPANEAEVVIRMPGSSLREIELQALRLALRLTGGRVVRASELLGITRHALRRKIEKFGLEELRHSSRDEPSEGPSTL